jgi:hypothetical protein
MGNSKLAQGCQTPSAPPSREPDPDNGILAQVPGDVVSRGLDSLAPPSAPGPDQREVVVDVEHIGQVRLFVVRKRSRHGRHSHEYWQTYRAEFAGSPRATEAESVRSESN